MHLIADSEISRYSRAPSAATVAAVSGFQEGIRDALGSDYEAFLQGSYKNDTSIKDINDVDIVAIRKQTVSGVFSKQTFSSTISWSEIFSALANRLGELRKFGGKVSRGDKCVIVKADWKADVVPAVKIGRLEEDPIAIYSFREGKERVNFPRLHYERGVAKNKATGGVYKAVVRMFKRWTANHWASGGVAPSFYVECLIHSVPDTNFTTDLAEAFFSVGYYIETNVLPSAAPVVYSVAGDKDILTDQEWKLTQYMTFHTKLVESTGFVASALEATTQSDAIRKWRAAFNE